MRSINAGLKAWYYAECEKVLAETLDDETIKVIVKKFAGIGVSVEQLETVTRPRQMGWTSQDRLKLLGLWNAIRDGQTTAEEVFGPVAAVSSGPAAATSQTTGPVKSADLEKPKEVAADLSLDAIAKRFGACKTPADVQSIVNSIKREHSDPPLTGEEWDEIDKLAALANERVGG